jgi:flagellar hook protein FlgE
MAEVTNIAVSALSAYTLKQTVTANNVANLNSSNFKASAVAMQASQGRGVRATTTQGSDRVEISREATDMILTSNGFKANLKVLQTADEMSKELLNIKA